MRQRGVCPGFGGSDLEKEYESGWGGLPASSAQAVGVECQAAAAAASTQSSAPAAPQLEAGGRVLCQLHTEWHLHTLLPPRKRRRKRRRERERKREKKKIPDTDL